MFRSFLACRPAARTGPRGPAPAARACAGAALAAALAMAAPAPRSGADASGSRATDGSPTVPAAAPAPADSAGAAARARGRALLETAAGLAGGADAWRAVRSVVIELRGSVTIPPEEGGEEQTMLLVARRSWSLPDRLVSVQTLPVGELRRVVDGASGWVADGVAMRDEPRAAEELAREYERSLWNLFGNAARVRAIALDTARTVQGVAHAAVRIEGGVPGLTLLFAPDGRLARIEYRAEGEAGSRRMSQALSDWRAVGALQYPHRVRTYVDGRPSSETTVTAITLDAALPDSLFARPRRWPTQDARPPAGRPRLRAGG
jgi:hypothetical protein